MGFQAFFCACELDTWGFAGVSHKRSHILYFTFQLNPPPKTKPARYHYLSSSNGPVYKNSAIRQLHIPREQKYPIPVNAFADGAVFGAEPDQYRFTYDVIGGYIAPDTGIFGVVAVIAHHPVVILFEGI